MSSVDRAAGSQLGSCPRRPAPASQRLSRASTSKFVVATLPPSTDAIPNATRMQMLRMLSSSHCLQRCLQWTGRADPVPAARAFMRLRCKRPLGALRDAIDVVGVASCAHATLAATRSIRNVETPDLIPSVARAAGLAQRMRLACVRGGGAYLRGTQDRRWPRAAVARC